MKAFRMTAVRQRWPLLLSVFAVIVLLRTLPTGEVERLPELPPGFSAVAVRDGMFLSLPPGGGIGLDATPATGGPRRTLIPPAAAPPPVGSESVTQQSVTVAGDRVLFRREEFARSAPRDGEGRVLSALDKGTQFWEASFDGRPPRELLPQMRVNGAIVSGRTYFWLRSLPPRQEPYRFRGQLAMRTVQESDVMATPIDGGPTRKIAGAVRSFTQLAPLGEGVCWSAPWSEDSRLTDLSVAQPPDFRVRVLPGYSTGAGAQTLFGDRYYWMERINPPMQGGGDPERLELCSIRTDGSDRVIVADLRHSRQWEPRGSLLGVHRGHLYCLLYERPAQPDEIAQQPTLCRIERGAIQKLYRLPAGVMGGTFDGRFLYCSSFETRENWLAWSGAGMAPKQVAVQFRCRLPD